MFDRIKKWLPFKRGDESVRRVPKTDSSQHPLARLEHEMNQVLSRVGSLWPSTEAGNWGADSWFGDFSPSTFTPTLDLADKRKHLEVTLELPGLDADDVEIEVHGDSLVIRGEKRVEETTEEDGFYRTERSFGAFHRVVPLPAEVEAERTEATFKNGVLKVRLPKTKTTEAESRRIAIKAS